MKITLIGSTKFKEDYEAANAQLTLCGHLVYSVSSFRRSTPPNADLTSAQKETLDLVHLAKIEESDAVVLVGEADGRPYIGDSTRRELRWAAMRGKRVYIWDEMADLNDPDPLHPADVMLLAQRSRA